MSRLFAVMLCVGTLCAAAESYAQARLRQHGRATIEFSDRAIKAVAQYDYSQKNHDGPWLLIDIAVQARERIAINRDQLYLWTPDNRRVPLATQEQFLEAGNDMRQLLQNASVLRRPFGNYFTTPVQETVQFFAFPGTIVHDSVVTNRDQVAAGPLFFKYREGNWPAGKYTLIVNHEKARAELPITLE